MFAMGKPIDPQIKIQVPPEMLELFKKWSGPALELAWMDGCRTGAAAVAIAGLVLAVVVVYLRKG